MSQRSSLQPGFHAIHANHLEDLRRAVVWISRSDPLPPLESETFLVQSNGIAQWLKLALAEDPTEVAGEPGGGLGIAAGMEFLFPARFIWQAYRAVLPAGEVPEESPFDKPRLLWRLYRLLPALKDDEVFRPLRRFLEGPDTEVRCFQLAEKIADLFDQYQVFRADWLDAWEAGQDHIVLARGEVRPLEEDLRWQPVLWRALVADTGELASSSRAHIHNRFMAAGAAAGSGSRPADLPPRIVVFGVSSLPRQALEALHVLSRFSQIVLCVHNPCQFYWADIVSDQDLLRAERRRGRLDHPVAGVTDPDQIHQHANPLLAAWGKQGRDYIRLLDVFDNPDDYRERLSTPGGSIDIYRPHGDEDNPAPLLHQIQNDIFQLTPQQDMLAGNRVLDPASDDSVIFHEAHSPQREVEVLHDQLLAAFSQDPALRPRDVIVMVPDINAYAPHIQAVFGRYSPDDERHIPFTISDQGQRHRQPLLIALETLLSLPEQRFGVSEVVSLLEVPALRTRFGIAEEDLPQLRQWVEGANIRWGLHEQQRASLELPEQLHANTWQFGLRRMLLGYSMGHESAWQSIESFGEVGGLQAALAGQLVEFVGQLERLWLALGKSRSPTDWLTLLTDLLADFFEQPDEQDLLLIRRLQDQAERWLLDCDSAGMTGVLPLNIVRDVLLDGLDEGGLNQRFLAGKVNFATLMPMRAIPFQRVCLLGMNDGDYPRSRPPVDFDLMAQDYRPGDRSRREDDRYLFLEALLSAREQLYISWVGRSIRDDSERPPSVLVAQLRDHLNDVWSQPQGDEPVAPALTTRHPLQPFSRAYFPSGSRQGERAQDVVSSGRLFTYDNEWRAVHLQGDVPVRLQQPLPMPELTEPLPVETLGRFLQSPVAAFFNQRLQIRFSGVEVSDTDNENFQLDGLDHWRLESELIQQAVMKAVDEADFMEKTDACLAVMAARGDLGMGITERQLQRDLQARLPDIFRRYQEQTALWPRRVSDPHPFSYRYESGHGPVILEGALDRLRQNPEGQWCRLVVASSKLLEGAGRNAQVRYHKLLTDWVLHLVAQAEGYDLLTTVIAKEEGKVIELPPMPAEEAVKKLNGLLAAWQEGMTRPLPVEAETAYAWLGGLYKTKGGGEEEALSLAQARYTVMLERDPGYLNGAWPDFDEMMASGEFGEWVSRLYQDVRQLSRG